MMWSGNKPTYYKTIDDFKNTEYTSTLAYLVFDLKKCGKPMAVLENVQNLFDLTHNWILLADNETFANFKRKATHFEMGVDTEIILAVFDGENAILHQVYKIKKQDSDLGIC